MDAGPKQDLWNLLPVIIVLLLGAAYFAIMETAFSSASRIRLKAAADHGNRRAESGAVCARSLRSGDHDAADRHEHPAPDDRDDRDRGRAAGVGHVGGHRRRRWSRPWSCSSPGRCCRKASPRNTQSVWPCATARSLRFFMVLFQPLSVLLTAIGNAAARCIPRRARRDRDGG